MSISKEIAQLNDLVHRLLIERPAYRDSDKALSARIWQDQMGGREAIRTISTFDFLCQYVSGEKLYSQESIGRCRRKLQEEHPDLRGKKWKERHEEEINVKRELGYE